MTAARLATPTSSKTGRLSSDVTNAAGPGCFIGCLSLPTWHRWQKVNGSMDRAVTSRWNFSLPEFPRDYLIMSRKAARVAHAGVAAGVAPFETPGARTRGSPRRHPRVSRTVRPFNGTEGTCILFSLLYFFCWVRDPPTRTSPCGKENPFRHRSVQFPICRPSVSMCAPLHDTQTHDTQAARAVRFCGVCFHV